MLNNFFSMGGYAVYVWTAYVIALTILIGNVIWPIIQKRFVCRKLKRQFQYAQHESKA